MAIADVFDAVSEDRCYRAAMPLEQCFKIIEEGRGEDFEPILVDVFLDIKDEIIATNLVCFINSVFFLFNNRHNKVAIRF